MIEPVPVTQGQEMYYVCRIEVFIMMFMKLNAHTVKCTIEEHEIIEMGYEIDDICRNEERASEFMKQIIEKGIEAGYKISEKISAVQATFLSNHQIVLCFTDEEPERLLDRTLDNLFDVLGHDTTLDKEKIEDISKKAGKARDALEECMEEIASAKEVSEILATDSSEEQQLKDAANVVPEQYILEFVNLDIVESFCKAAPAVPGKLYKDKGRYYLVSDLTNAENGKKRSFLLQANEFTTSLKKEYLQMGYLEEHCEILVKENPMEVLKQL